MNVVTVPFYVGLLSVAALFFLSFILGVFIRATYLALKKFPAVKPAEKKKRKRKLKSPAAVRSIEIDPEQIERIYVKKVS